ncbi:toxin-antitoxin system HicB family antitoxin [Enterococcus sp. AZ072]|uniref:toxin-antitoxin system HicB family antitoxin n=1 Tax=unclassified Enterococcus TaxID=2608891 RepID=UPI003D2CB7F7
MVKNKPNERSIAIQVPAELHKEMKLEATKQDKSLKQFIIDTMSKEVGWSQKKA